MNFFTRAKHWKLFLMMFAVPLVLEIVIRVFYIVSLYFYAGKSGSSDVFMTLLKINFLATYLNRMFAIVVFLGWLWSIVVGLQKSLPAEAKMEIGYFKALVIFIVCWSFLIVALSFVYFQTLGNIVGIRNPYIYYIVIVSFFQLIKFSCVFYVIYFAAKTFKSFELQRPAKIGDYVETFFLFLFYPIGVWFIQPKINQLSSEGRI